jgi:hypothetical protein
LLIEAGTSEITAYTFYFKGYNINLVDTPGFNDTHRSETEVLQDIAKWLRETYEGDSRLNGIIYLHSINNVRMEGSALRNLKMFRQLCGKEPLKNVILATTFWSKVEEEDALRREEQLRETPEFWGDMLSRGSTMKRLENQAGALDIISLLVRKPGVTLQIQHELVEDKKSLVDTAAGQAVNEELMRLQQKHAEELERVQKELREALAEHDQEMQQILNQQQQRLNNELERVRKQQDLLRYDRRAERRKAESDMELRMLQVREEVREEMHEQYEQRMMAERQAMLQQLTFDEAVAVVRANEGKIPASEREALELKITELTQELAGKATKAKPGEKSPRKKKGGSKYLFRALQVALPVTTTALLGVPIFMPSGSGAGGVISEMFGGGETGGEPAA